MKPCLDCGADISGLHGNSVRCSEHSKNVATSQKRKRDRERKRNRALRSISFTKQGPILKYTPWVPDTEERKELAEVAEVSPLAFLSTRCRMAGLFVVARPRNPRSRLPNAR